MSKFTIDDCIEHCDVIYKEIELLPCERKGIVLLAVVGLQMLLKEIRGDYTVPLMSIKVRKE